MPTQPPHHVSSLEFRIYALCPNIEAKRRFAVADQNKPNLPPLIMQNEPNSRTGTACRALAMRNEPNPHTPCYPERRAAERSAAAYYPLKPPEKVWLGRSRLSPRRAGTCGAETIPGVKQITQLTILTERKITKKNEL